MEATHKFWVLKSMKAMFRDVYKMWPHAKLSSRLSCGELHLHIIPKTTLWFQVRFNLIDSSI